MLTQADYVTHILEMKNGTDKCTPQPDYARDALRYYVELLPWLELNNAIREAMKAQTCES